MASGYGSCRWRLRYPTSLAFEPAGEPSAHPSKLANLDAALRGIKVDSTNLSSPLEFEFKVLNANLMAPLPAVVIILSSARASRGRQHPRSRNRYEHRGTIQTSSSSSRWARTSIRWTPN